MRRPRQPAEGPAPASPGCGRSPSSSRGRPEVAAAARAPGPATRRIADPRSAPRPCSPIPASVSVVRTALEQRISSGSIPSIRKCSASALTARRPRGASGRSWSSSPGSSQLDLTCRRTNSCFVPAIPAGLLRVLRLDQPRHQSLASPAQGEIAQLVEHTTENRGVPGSIPGLAIAKSPANCLASGCGRSPAGFSSYPR